MGLAFVDASCGEFFVTELDEENLILELGRLRPSEVLAPLRVQKPGPDEVVPREVLEAPELVADQYRFKGRPAMFFQTEPATRRILETFQISTLEGFGCQENHWLSVPPELFWNTWSAPGRAETLL